MHAHQLYNFTQFWTIFTSFAFAFHLSKQDPYGEKRGQFQYSALKISLQKIKKQLDEEETNKTSDADTSSTSDNEMDTSTTMPFR